MAQFGTQPIPPAELSRIAVPTALIWGRHDMATPLRVLLWNGMMAKAPALVLQPGDARDVATAVRFARDHGLLLSIKSGGHNMPSAPTSTSTSALAPFANSASTRSPWSTKPVRRCPRCNRPAGTPAASADSRSARCIW
jgi:pimeloyl-ACP methyl ester carboxylesterase